MRLPKHDPVSLNFFPTKLVARPEIKRPEDLKGKILAVRGFGAANHMALLVALEKLGVSAKEVSIIQVAGGAAQLAALTKGAVQGLMFNEPQATIAINKFGMQSLIDLMTPATIARSVLCKLVATTVTPAENST